MDLLTEPTQPSLPKDEKSLRTVINLRRFLDRRKSANWPPKIVQLEAAIKGREDKTPLWRKEIYTEQLGRSKGIKISYTDQL